ncbi:MAG: sporulation integral membrane protein YtvI [Clostridia bacterium]|nr:sporulation integral membrane protein YtvI [Clostridia bacterium]
MERRETIKKTVIYALVLIGIAIFFKFFASLFLPFIIALGIAFILNYPIKLLHRRTGLSKRILSALTVSAVTFLLGFLVFLLINRLINELRSFIVSVSENADRYISDFFKLIDKITERIPFIDAVGADLSETVTDVVKGMLTAVTSRLPGIIANIIAMLPHILLFTVIIILASYYFCADFDKIKENILSVLPEGARNALSRFKKRLTDTGLKYLRACAVMLIITYFELLVGFLMLGIPYAFSLSLLVAAVDMLPIFGVGTVLVPWAIWCKLSGDTYTAIGLLIIFATVTVIRRFIEPKVISTGIGLSPITTLFAMYVGFRLFGLTGLFFSPLAAILILHALPEELAKKLGFSGGKEVKKEDELNETKSG